MDAGKAVRELYEAYGRRAWTEVEPLLDPAAEVEMPATGERLVGRDRILRFQREYPEPWGRLTVRRVLAAEAEAVAEVEVVAPEGTVHRMAAFWEARRGLLYRGVEYWVSVGADRPPPGRPTAFPS